MDNDALLRRISALSGSKREQAGKQAVEVRGSHHLYEPDEPVRAPVRYETNRYSHTSPDTVMEPATPAVHAYAQDVPATEPVPAPTTAATSASPSAARPFVSAPPPLAMGSTPPKGTTIELVDDVPPADPLSESALREPLLHAEHDMAAFLAGFRPVARPPATAPAEAERENATGQENKRKARPGGHIIACDGNTAVVQGTTECLDSLTGLTWSVGRMVSVRVADSRIVGVICDITMPEGPYKPDETAVLHFHIELQGEVKECDDGTARFTSGISAYPGVGCDVHQIRAGDLEAIFAISGLAVARVGVLSQDDSVSAVVDVADMLSKHFAVLGSTGSGKSGSVTLLLHAMRAVVPELRSIILDPHNEYTRAFPDAHTINSETLDLPFWMFQLEEYVEVLYRGRPSIDAEIEILREFIPQAKARFMVGDSRVGMRSGGIGTSLTADTIAPYRIADLLSLLDDEAGQLESQFERSSIRTLRARISAQANDPRYTFMFRHRTISDLSEQIVASLFNLAGSEQRQTIIQLGGMPVEVINSVAAVISRMTFELAVAAKGQLKLLVLCEEAHRYVPVAVNGFEPARRAIARIAKEGRKYGAFMGIVTQRPSELDPTILSQCSTVFAMRLSNQVDQDIVRKAIASSSDNAVGFLSSLAGQECIAFGEGAPTPMRMKFFSLPGKMLPGAEAGVFEAEHTAFDEMETRNLVAHWRKSSG